MLDWLNSREYRARRTGCAPDISEETRGMDAFEAHALSFEKMIEAERPNLFEEDIFGFNRTVGRLPVCPRIGYAENGCAEPVGNITPNYAGMIEKGFDETLREIDERAASADDHAKSLYSSVKRHINALLGLCERYRAEAETRGCVRLASALERVPRQSAESFYEACLFMKILHFSLRCCPYEHLTLGRFDQYMYRYYLHDVEKGVSREELLETLELFFIALNFDSDLYHGIQQGDNGQSVVLGGFDRDGANMFNGLSELCMDASLELCLIDPKINLRVGRNTPFELYEYGTRMTQKGLGFPQYCNDDVVVPGLVALGYDRDDAINYTVAACWEFIVPNCGMDVPNIGVFNFPLVVNDSIREHLRESDSFEALMEHIKRDIADKTIECAAESYGRRVLEAPYLSLFVDGCVERGRDVSDNAAGYNNSGIHGAGISNAADALAAVRRVVFDEKSVSADTLFAALDADFVGYDEVRRRLLDCPKMGNNDDYVDSIACEITGAFADTLNGRPNGRGGIFRAGTGSAMAYVFSARECPATADGRRSGEYYSSSYSPSLSVRLNGPLSVIQSFTKFDMTRIINGGPLTMEIHDTVFRNEDGIRKVAQLVEAFIRLGGHQLQLNAINRERLLDAREHPEDYPNLIVRVWGWSGYFCELDPEYQEHIITRAEFGV